MSPTRPAVPAPRAALPRRLHPAAAALLAAALAAAAPAGAGLPDHPAVASGPPPSWVEPPGEPPPVPPGVSAVAYRLVDDQLLVRGDRTASYSLELVEVLSQQGLEDASQWEVQVDPASQRLVVHALEVYRDGAWHDRLDTARGSLLQRERELERRIYDESRTLLLVADDVRVGDLVRFAYTVEGFNPVLGDRYAGSLGLAWGVPVGERRLRVLSPADRRLFYRVHGPADRSGLVRPEQGTGLHELAWRRRPVPAVDPEPDTPDDWVAYPFLQISEFASWAEVAEWGRALYSDPVPSPELGALAAEIAAAHPGDPGARLIAASRWVQDEVRYFAVALGPHSHAPHPVGEVLRHRYGDCKDKARLLVALLGELGVEAWPALVDTETGGGVAGWRPSPFAFDHVVVVARLGDRTLWIDPTVELQGGSAADLWFPDYGRALELRPGVGELTAIPPEQTRPGTTAVGYDYRVEEVGDPLAVVIATTWERAGAERMRRSLASATVEDLQERYVEYYTDGDRTVEPLAPLEIADDREANRLTVTERYRVVGCWDRVEGTLACDLLPLTLDDALVAPGSVRRRAPLRLSPGVHTRETVSIHAGTTWEFQPIATAERNPWFEFSVSSTPGERDIELVYELTTLASRVEPEKVAAYSEAVGEVRDALGYSLSLEDGGSPAGGGGAPDGLLASFYPLFGCLAVVALLLVPVAVVVVLWMILRRRRPAAVCPRCGSAPAPGARFCTGCGAPLPAPASRAGGVGLWVGLGAAGCLVAVAMVGIIAAILIPNFIDALGRAKQKRTTIDMLQIAADLEVYRANEGTYPATADVGELVELLNAVKYPGETPVTAEDGWKRPLHYTCIVAETEDIGCAEYRLVSAGADGELEHADPADYREGTLAGSEVDRDLVVGPEGTVIQGPG